MSNPIHKVLSTLKLHDVKCLLMGGQACVFYGAAEFSRDTDVALLASTENLNKLKQATEELEAELVAVPKLNIDYLKKGHAIHFRCNHPEADGMRLDVMSVMRGLPGFTTLWKRRTTVQINNLESIELMGLSDLVNAKKTQRDKDWPMIRRLVESHYVQFSDVPSAEKIDFWLTELRTPALLRKIGMRFPDLLEISSKKRPFLQRIVDMTDENIETALADEEAIERVADREYWKPLRKELEQFRHDLLRG